MGDNFRLVGGPMGEVSVHKERNMTIDILKDIGILFMVIGHSGAPLDRFIYLFHMALFFMVSGYLWSDNKAQNFPAAKAFLVSRLKGLLLPYAL